MSSGTGLRSVTWLGGMQSVVSTTRLRDTRRMAPGVSSKTLITVRRVAIHEVKDDAVVDVTFRAIATAKNLLDFGAGIGAVGANCVGSDIARSRVWILRIRFGRGDGVAHIRLRVADVRLRRKMSNRQAPLAHGLHGHRVHVRSMGLWVVDGKLTWASSIRLALRRDVGGGGGGGCGHGALRSIVGAQAHSRV